jgi:isopentenyl-diphosphate delta-isomerase
MTETNDQRVSFDDEPLILVNAADEVVGHAPKRACHEGEGILHRAFSVLLFDHHGQVLLQQRAADKWLWPLTWSNACCSHPRRGETVPDAARRRLAEELGVAADLAPAFTFTYHARYRDVGSEREVCTVLLGRLTGEVRANPTEIAAWRLVPAPGLEAELAADPDRFTPWFRMELERLRRDHAAELAALGVR